MIITFTAEQCRFAFDLIRHRPIQEAGKVSFELVNKVEDHFLDTDEVDIEISPADLSQVYLLINAEEGDVDSIRADMKLALGGQIQIALSETPTMVDQKVDDPDFVQPDPDNPVDAPKVTIQVPEFSDNWHEWMELYGQIVAIQQRLDNKKANRILSGKQHLQSLR